MKCKINYQVAVSNSSSIPLKKDVIKWIKKAAQFVHFNDDFEITIRIVSPQEIQHLNKTFRHKNKPTNVLSFSYDKNSEEMGDIVICRDAIEQEAKEQKIALPAHWAHIVIHGFLHLLGYDHQDEKSATIMEQKEIKILGSLSKSASK